MSLETPVKRPLILIVEDESDIRFAVEQFLKLEGYDVQTSKNGQEALDWLARGQVPNLILLDMKMPVMSGWDFAKIYYEKYHYEIPLLVVTAAPDAEARAREVCAKGWLGKPFKLDELVAKIRELLGQ